MSATHTSVASSGSATAVLLSSLAAQTTQVYNLLIVAFVFMIVLVVLAVICFCIWLKTRKSRKTLIDPERGIPLANLSTRPSSPKPAPPARNPNRPFRTTPFVPTYPQAPARPTPPIRAQTAPQDPLNQRPILPQSQQSHGADYSSGRPRRFNDDHLSQSGPSASVHVHNNSALGPPGSRQMDKINNS